MTAPSAAASSSRCGSSCCKMACRRGQVTTRHSGGSGAAGGRPSGLYGGYRSSRTLRPWAAMADRVGASWMEEKAFNCRARIMASAASTATTSTAGTTTVTLGSLPMTRAVVTENTKTPMASPNVRHTMGSSRNRFSRGDRLEKAHCTTRNSSEKMMLTSPSTPKPTPISVSVNPAAGHSRLGGDPRQQQPEAHPGHREHQLDHVGPQPPAGPVEPPGPAGGGPAHHRPPAVPHGSPARQRRLRAGSGLPSASRGSRVMRARLTGDRHRHTGPRTAAVPRRRHGIPGRAAVRDDELVLNMLRTLPVLPTLQLEVKDVCACRPHPPVGEVGRACAG